MGLFIKDALLITNGDNNNIILCCYCDKCKKECSVHYNKSDLSFYEVIANLKDVLKAENSNIRCTGCFDEIKDVKTSHMGVDEMSDNYVFVNGKKICLTQKTLKEVLKIISESDWARCLEGDKYFYIDEFNTLQFASDDYENDNNMHYENNNYSKNEDKMRVRLAERLMNYELEKYKDENDSEIVWDNHSAKYFLAYDNKLKKWEIELTYSNDKAIGVAYFTDKEVIKKALTVFQDDLDRLKTLYDELSELCVMED